MLEDDDTGGFTSSERKALRQLLMRVGDDKKIQAVEALANNSADIINLVESKKATSAVLKFTERCVKWAVVVGGGVIAMKNWFWGGHAP